MVPGHTARRALACLVCLAWCGNGCDDYTGRGPITPTIVAQPPAPPSPPLPPAPLDEPHTTIAVGDVVRHRFTQGDPVCREYPELSCLFYRLTPAVDGTLTLTLTALARNPQPLDVSLRDPQFSRERWWDPVVAEVKAGVTYQITVWYGTPGAEFELRSGLRPH